MSITYQTLDNYNTYSTGLYDTSKDNNLNYNSKYELGQSIEKYKMNNDTEFEYDKKFQLNGNFQVQNGILIGPNIEDGIEIPGTGTKPSYGELTYLQEDLQKGCLTMKKL